MCVFLRVCVCVGVTDKPLSTHTPQTDWFQLSPANKIVWESLERDLSDSDRENPDGNENMAGLSQPRPRDL